MPVHQGGPYLIDYSFRALVGCGIAVNLHRRAERSVIGISVQWLIGDIDYLVDDGREGGVLGDYACIDSVRYKSGKGGVACEAAIDYGSYAHQFVTRAVDLALSIALERLSLATSAIFTSPCGAYRSNDFFMKWMPFIFVVPFSMK